jgi:hypothetical protein
MGQPLGPQPLGTSRSYPRELSGVQGASLAGHFTGTETFLARIWPGGTYPTLATLTASWDATVAGNPATLARPILLITVPASAIAALEEGTYQYEVIADPGTVDELLDRGQIKLVDSAGATAVPRTYCSLRDMVAECAWIEDAEGLQDARAANFLRERASASRWLERQAMARWSRAMEDQGSRHAAVAALAAIVPTSGIDAGPAWGDSSIPDATHRAAESAFAALLDSAGLMVDAPPDRDGLRRAAALYSLFEALDDQVGKDAAGSSFQAQAAKFRSRAVGMLRGVTLRVDSDADGVADFTLRY